MKKLFCCLLICVVFVQTQTSSEFRIENEAINEKSLEIPKNTKSIIIRNTTLRHLDLLKFDGVKILHLSRNLIQQISQKTLQSTNVLSINLSHNEIKEIETYAFTIPPLQQLDLSHNHLRKLSVLSAKPLLELQALHLDSNEIEAIPEGFFEFLFKLEIFTANNNYLKVINLRSLYYLQQAQVSNNYLQNAVFANPKMTDLNLSSNNLDIANVSNLVQCTNLLTLDLSQNPIGNITQIKLINLEELKIANLKLITSHMLPALDKLKILDFSDNDFPHFENLEKLKSLNLLVLDGNKLSSLNFTLPESLTYIGLNDNEFSCNYLQELLAKLRGRGIRLYFRTKKATDANVQGVKCQNVDDIDEKVEACKLEDEDFIYAWHTSLSLVVCLASAIVYFWILWEYRDRIRNIKDQESDEQEWNNIEESPYTYNNLLVKCNSDT